MKLLHLLTALSFVLFVGCGGGSEKQSTTDTESANEGQTEMGSDARTIDVYGIDQMKFVVEEKADGLQVGESVQVNGKTYYILTGINAAPGEEITVNLETISKLPETAMSHNWLLLKQGTDTQAFATASLKAKDSDYIAADMKDQVMAETGLVAGGESGSVTFTVPEQTGDYDYLCTFPGHFSAGMKGTLTVGEGSGSAM